MKDFVEIVVSLMIIGSIAVSGYKVRKRAFSKLSREHIMNTTTC